MANVEETFEELKSHFRTPIVAQIGGFRPPDDPRCSWFGAGCANPGENVPQHEGRDMFPLLQINCEELPSNVPAFGESKLVVVYISNATIPFDTEHGDGWEIREYDNLEGLVPVVIERPANLKPLPIRWKLGEPERPGWGDSWEVVDMEPINSDEAAADAFFDLPHFYGTKIGGYPSDVQDSIEYCQDFIFQIGSEEKTRWRWGDQGVGYFSRTPDSEWKFEWQCS